MSQNDPGSPHEKGSQFLGHPVGLFPLFFTEMWERFSFYLMQGLLTLYMVNYLGFSPPRASDVTTWYMSLVYFTPFLGGLIADRLTGYPRAIMAGGALMMAGHIALAFDSREDPRHLFLFGAMALLILGNGLFKPNISTMVGNLYALDDPRRDQGFTIFYMGINVGALGGPLAAATLMDTRTISFLRRATGWNLTDESGWHIAFGSAGFGMLLSLLIFAANRRRLPDPGSSGDRLAPAADPRASTEFQMTDRGDRALRIGQWFNIIAVPLALAWLIAEPRGAAISMEQFGLLWLVIELITVGLFLSGGDTPSANAAKLKSIFVVVALFWMAFHQSAVTLPLFAQDHLRGELNPVLSNAINPAFVILLSPLMVMLWSALGRRGREPATTTKIAMGMVVTALAFLVMVAAGRAGGDTGRVSYAWLIGCYGVLTVAELMLSPIGLSLTSRLAPPRYRGLWMGFWFMATAVGNKLVHVIGQYWPDPKKLAEGIPQYLPSELFLILVVTSVGAAVLLALVLVLLKWLSPKATPA